MSAQEIPFLLGGAQGQPGQAAELLHKKWDIKIGPRLLNEARQVQADRQERSRVRPIESFSQGNYSSRPVEREGQRKAFQGSPGQAQECRAGVRCEIVSAEVPIHAHTRTARSWLKKLFQQQLTRCHGLEFCHGRLLGHA